MKSRHGVAFQVGLYLTALSSFCVPVADAHVALDSLSVRAGGEADIKFRVGHGCSGSPTVSLKIRMPQGVVAVRPEPKLGWTISSETHVYDSSQHLKGALVAEGIGEITWSGRLAGDRPDVFAVHVAIADEVRPGEKLVFPVLQQCEDGVERWIDEDEEADHPAPQLIVDDK